MMINKRISSNNDVKGARTSWKGSSSGSGRRQADRGRYHAKSCLDSHHEGGCDDLSSSTSRTCTNTVERAKNMKKMEAGNTRKKKEDKYVNIRIATINVRTCQDDMKLADIVKAASDLNLDVLAIQEARRLGKGDDFTFGDGSLSGWQLTWSGHRRKREHGLATVLAPTPNLRNSRNILLLELSLPKLL